MHSIHPIGSADPVTPPPQPKVVKCPCCGKPATPEFSPFDGKACRYKFQLKAERHEREMYAQIPAYSNLTTIREQEYGRGFQE